MIITIQTKASICLNTDWCHHEQGHVLVTPPQENHWQYLTHGLLYPNHPYQHTSLECLLTKEAVWRTHLIFMVCSTKSISWLRQFIYFPTYPRSNLMVSGMGINGQFRVGWDGCMHYDLPRLYIGSKQAKVKNKSKEVVCLSFKILMYFYWKG